MATFVLVHGSWHGAWCWYRIIPRLRQHGHTVIAPDLSALGADKTPIRDVTLARWREDVCKAIDSANEPVILVGHSRGGLLISEAAEARPEKVRTLVYLAAFLLRDGESLFAMSSLDTETLLKGNLQISADGLSATVNDTVIDAAFYGQSPAEDVALARTLLQPEPLVPLNTPVHLTAARYGSVPRVYIECLQDKAISLSAQRRLHEQTPCKQILSIDTDHSPFFSAPDQLTGHLVSLTL